MKNKTNHTHFGNFVFWLVAICHYLFGASGLVCTLLMATAKTNDSQNLLGFFAVVCIIAFAMTQPDIKCRRLDTGWDFLDRKIEFLKKTHLHK